MEPVEEGEDPLRGVLGGQPVVDPGVEHLEQPLIASERSWSTLAWANCTDFKTSFSGLPERAATRPATWSRRALCSSPRPRSPSGRRSAGRRARAPGPPGPRRRSSPGPVPLGALAVGDAEARRDLARGRWPPLRVHEVPTSTAVGADLRRPKARRSPGEPDPRPERGSDRPRRIGLPAPPHRATGGAGVAGSSRRRASTPGPAAATAWSSAARDEERHPPAGGRLHRAPGVDPLHRRRTVRRDADLVGVRGGIALAPLGGPQQDPVADALRRREGEENAVRPPPRRVAGTTSSLTYGLRVRHRDVALQRHLHRRALGTAALPPSTTSGGRSRYAG